MNRTRIIVALLALLLAGAIGALWWQLRRSLERASALASLDAERASWSAKVDQLSREVAEVRSQLQQCLDEGEPRTEAPKRPVQGPPPPPDTNELVAAQAKLVAVTAELARSAERIRELEAAAERSAAENQKVAAHTQELSEKVASLNRIVDAMGGELKGKESRLQQLDSANRTLREESRKSAEQISRLVKLGVEMEEINRRRETYLTSILRRYREVTDQYRVLAVRMDTGREQQPPPVIDLSRIQNAIQTAEEDLRLLQQLNAQASSLQRKYKGN